MVLGIKNWVLVSRVASPGLTTVCHSTVTSLQYSGPEGEEGREGLIRRSSNGIGQVKCVFATFPSGSIRRCQQQNT